MDDFSDDSKQLKKKCSVFDHCRACTFRELQEIDVCQTTGFRLIMHCKTTAVDNREDVLSESYQDKACEEAATEMTPLRDGEFAPYRSGPLNLYWFFVIMSGLTYGVLRILMQRRSNILNQVYSKLSIVKTKN